MYTDLRNMKTTERPQATSEMSTATNPTVKRRRSFGSRVRQIGRVGGKIVLMTVVEAAGIGTAPVLGPAGPIGAGIINSGIAAESVITENKIAIKEGRKIPNSTKKKA